MPPAEAHGGNATSSSTLRGEVIYLYAFDVASEIQLERLPDLLACQPSTPLAETGASGRAVPRSVPLARPVSIEIPPITSRMKGEQIRVQARVYEVGVITITVRLTVASQSLAEFNHFHEPVLDDGQPLDRFARSQCIEIRRKIASAMIRSEPETEPEAYTVFAFSQLANSRDVNSWLAEHSREVAGLLTATAPERLSEAQVAEVLRLKRSFENTDLVVLDWDAALVVELEGPIDEVLFVLDLANLQLEEFRWMDRALDRYLDEAYDDLARRRWWKLGTEASVLRSLRRLRIDLTKLADEVTHTTKFIGDWHLARVYVMARERFHLDQWRASVDQRLGELSRLYSLIRGDLYERRMLWLEAVIVLFFALDLLILILK